MSAYKYLWDKLIADGDYEGNYNIIKNAMEESLDWYTFLEWFWQPDSLSPLPLNQGDPESIDYELLNNYFVSCMTIEKEALKAIIEWREFEDAKINQET